jgi:4-hydroxy-tetrahydrodipicolinate reductase
MVKIGLLGCGQMGVLIEQIATAYHCQIVAKYDPLLNIIASDDTLKQCDVYIDFTQPDAVLANVKKCAIHGKAIVIGTTGWISDLDNIKEVAEKYGTGIIYGSNFSLGMNIFYHILQNTAQLMQKCPEYDVFGYEMHHRLKKDSPSGTAKKICEILQKEIPQKTITQFDKVDRRILPHELHFASIRGGAIPGTHAVEFDSFADTIEIKHTARNRNGFAIGALKAANWISGRKGVYQFEDIFLELLK